MQRLVPTENKLLLLEPLISRLLNHFPSTIIQQKVQTPNSKYVKACWPLGGAVATLIFLLIASSSAPFLKKSQRIPNKGRHRPDLTDLALGQLWARGQSTKGWLSHDGRNEKPHRHQISDRDTGNKMIKNLTGSLTVLHFGAYKNDRWEKCDSWLDCAWLLCFIVLAKAQEDT